MSEQSEQSGLKGAMDAWLAATPGDAERARYDLTWAIAIAGRGELEAAVGLLWEAPYVDLPAPILTLIWRLAGLETEDPELMRQAAGSAAAHCSPWEEVGATAGIRARLAAIEGG